MKKSSMHPTFIRLTDLQAGKPLPVAAKKIKTVLVPTEDIVFLTTELPLASPNKLRKAAPFSVEEKVLDDIEELHFSLGRQNKDGSLPLAGIKKTTLQDWYALLLKHHISATHLIPEVLAIPYKAHSWQIFLVDHKALIRSSPTQGFSMPLASLPSLLPLLLNEESRPESIEVHYTEAHADYSFEQLPVLPLPITRAQSSTTASLIFTEGLQKGLPELNLLQDAECLKDIKNQFHFKHRPYAKWLKVAAISTAGAWIAIQLVTLGVFVFRTQSANAEIRALYQSVFPESPVNDIQKRVSQKLSTIYQTPSGAFLRTMLDLGTQLKKHNGTIVIHQLTWTDHALTLDATAPALQTFQKLSDALHQQYYQVNLEGTTSLGDHMNAHLTIKANS